jgi:hypothetical protein
MVQGKHIQTIGGVMQLSKPINVPLMILWVVVSAMVPA